MIYLEIFEVWNTMGMQFAYLKNLTQCSKVFFPWFWFQFWILQKISSIVWFLSQFQQGVCHTVALPFTLKSILRKKKNYEKSNISPC